MRSKPLPSVTEIAAASGVSAMSVSNALRDNNHVSAATRARILRVAKRLGYQPDPLLTHLMHHVRSRRVRHTQANLGVLLLNDDAYSLRLIAGVEERAAQLGYAVDKIVPEPFDQNPAGLTRMLQARGIEGLLLPTARVPKSLVTLLDWSRRAQTGSARCMLQISALAGQPSPASSEPLHFGVIGVWSNPGLTAYSSCMARRLRLQFHGRLIRKTSGAPYR